MNASRTFFVALSLVVGSGTVYAGAAPGDPDATEQLYIYLLNLARNSPARFQTENSLSVDLSTVTPRPPLALNRSLNGSASFHAEEMANSNYFDHTSAVTGDAPNKLALDAGYTLPSFYPPTANNIESIAAGFPDMTPLNSLILLIVDNGINPPGHRIHLLGMNDFFAEHKEVGVGQGFNQNSDLRQYYAIHTARVETGDTFLTGVVFNDANSNKRYDLNEGLDGVTVSTGALTTTTNSAGGWTIKVPAGAYAVTCSGGSFSGTATANATVSTDNVEVDFISGSATGDINFALAGGGGGGGGGGGSASNTATDTDSDGFPDEIETVLQTDPSSAASTPFGGASAGSTQLMTVPKLQISLNFGKPNSDGIGAQGLLPVPVAFTLTGKQVVIDVGGVVRSFILDAKGSSPKSTIETLKLRAKTKDGVTALAQDGKWQLKISKSTLAASFADEGLTNTTIKGKSVTVPLIVLFNQGFYRADLPRAYTAKQGKTGKAK